jgi:hypothetical protein
MADVSMECWQDTARTVVLRVYKIGGRMATGYKIGFKGSAVQAFKGSAVQGFSRCPHDPLNL